MRRFSLRFRYLIYALTAACVLAFQSWWLHDGFSLRRKALLDNVSTQVQQFHNLLIIQRLAPTLSINGADTSQIELGTLLAKDALSKADTQKLIAARQQIERGASSISLNIATPVHVADIRPDSQLYGILREVIPELEDSTSLIVSHRAGSQLTSFPRGSAYLNQNNTGWIESESPRLGSIDVRIPALGRIILTDMVPAILFSMLYLCLFLWTILALVRTARENRRLLESKANFTQNMTHELKIPISGLFLAAEALDRFGGIEDPVKARRHLATIRTGLQQLSALVDRILNTARLQQRQVRLQRAITGVKPLLEQVLADMAPMMEARGVIVRAEDVSAHDTIYGDADQLRYVFFNLIDNAIKYSPGVPVITVSFRAEGREHLIEIADKGVGIAAEHHDRVFEPYFRVPQHDLHDVKGFGLGLNIVRQIVSLHDGTVAVLRSGPGGTTVQIRLPRHDA